jgi:hypothetical protein
MFFSLHESMNFNQTPHEPPPIRQATKMHGVLKNIHIVYNAFTKWHRSKYKHDGSKALHLFQGRRFQGKTNIDPPIPKEREVDKQAR